MLFVPRLLCVACCLRVDVHVCSLLRFPRSVCYGVVVCCRCWIVVRAGVVCCIIIADVVRFFLLCVVLARCALCVVCCSLSLCVVDC